MKRAEFTHFEPPRGYHMFLFSITGSLPAFVFANHWERIDRSWEQILDDTQIEPK